jgi:hypothetical protein
MSVSRRIVPFPAVRVDFSAVPAAFTPAAPAVAQVPGRGKILVITNSLNAEVAISFDPAGVIIAFHLPASIGITLTLGANDVEFANPIHVKYQSGAPSSGFICFGVVRVQ